MKLQKLNPWNWFQHEHSIPIQKDLTPVKQGEYVKSAYPVSNMHQVHREIDRVFDDMFRGFGMSSLSQSFFPNLAMNDEFMQSFTADVNIACDDERYTITLEAPGLDQEDLSIDLDERTLVIKGNKQQKTEDKDKHFYHIERHYGAFERVLALPDDADVESIQAGMDRGLLTITIARKETEDKQTKRIDINH